MLERYRSERSFQLVYFLLAALLMVFTWGFVQLADFSNRVHVLIFWSLLSAYVPMVIGMALLWEPCKPKYEARAERHRSVHEKGPSRNGASVRPVWTRDRPKIAARVVTRDQIGILGRRSQMFFEFLPFGRGRPGKLCA
jgi:hypothetical protein